MSATQAAPKDVAARVVVVYFQGSKGKLACFTVDWDARQETAWRLIIEPKVTFVYRRYLDRLIATLDLRDVPPTPKFAASSPSPERRTSPRRSAGAPPPAVKRLEYALADPIVRVGVRVKHRKGSKRGVVEDMKGDACYVRWDGAEQVRRKATPIANLIVEVLGADVPPAAPDREGQEVLVTGASDKTEDLLGRKGYVMHYGPHFCTVRLTTAAGTDEERRLETAHLHAVEEPRAPTVEAAEGVRRFALDDLLEVHAAHARETGQAYIGDGRARLLGFVAKVKGRRAAAEAGGGDGRARASARPKR